MPRTPSHRKPVAKKTGSNKRRNLDKQHTVWRGGKGAGKFRLNESRIGGRTAKEKRRINPDLGTLFVEEEKVIRRPASELFVNLGAERRGLGSIRQARRRRYNRNRRKAS